MFSGMRAVYAKLKINLAWPKALDTLVAYSLAFPWLFIVRKHLHVQVHCALCTVDSAQSTHQLEIKTIFEL